MKRIMFNTRCWKYVLSDYRMATANPAVLIKEVCINNSLYQNIILYSVLVITPSINNNVNYILVGNQTHNTC